MDVEGINHATWFKARKPLDQSTQTLRKQLVGLLAEYFPERKRARDFLTRWANRGASSTGTVPPYDLRPLLRHRARRAADPDADADGGALRAGL